MDYLFDLTIYTFPNGEDREGYGIGLFKTEQQAQETASYYLDNVPGFRDYYCEAEITRLCVPGCADADMVYRYVGWNVDENGDETDIIESSCYIHLDAAQQDLEQAKIETPRQEWTLDPWPIGSLCWHEGFQREYPGGKNPPTLRQVRALLRGAMAPRKMVKVAFHYSDTDRDFFPLQVGKDLFLATEEFDFLLDGYTIRRIRDVEALELRPDIYTSIMKAEGALDRITVPEVDISDWKRVFLSLQKLDRNIIVEEERRDGNSGYALGFIRAVADDRIHLIRFDADGIWDTEPVEIPYAGITSVGFGSRYITVFSKYLPPRP